MNLGTFVIESMILHDVPRHHAHREAAEEILFSDEPSVPTDAVRNVFTERIVRSLSKNHYEVERDAESTSPVPARVSAIAIAHGDDATVQALVEGSQEMARHLFTSQTGSNPPGLLIVSRGRVDGERAVSIVKLEREDAIRVELTGDPGHRTFDVQHLRDLMLGKNTRVFKASLFKVPSAGELDGLVSDAQRSDPRTEVADFFLGRFLGCKLKAAPDLTTRDFFVTTQEFINTIADPEKKRRYEIALIAAMNLPAKTLSPSAVVNQLDTEDRQPYRQFLASHDAPTGSFDKDTRLIDTKIKQLVFGFQQSGLRLSGPPEDVEKFVRINSDPGEGAAPVEIHDQVRDVRGGTR